MQQKVVYKVPICIEQFPLTAKHLLTPINSYSYTQNEGKCLGLFPSFFPFSAAIRKRKHGREDSFFGWLLFIDARWDVSVLSSFQCVRLTSICRVHTHGCCYARWCLSPAHSRPKTLSSLVIKPNELLSEKRCCVLSVRLWEAGLILPWHASVYKVVNRMFLTFKSRLKCFLLLLLSLLNQSPQCTYHENKLSIVSHFLFSNFTVVQKNIKNTFLCPPDPPPPTHTVDYFFKIIYSAQHCTSVVHCRLFCTIQSTRHNNDQSPAVCLREISLSSLFPPLLDSSCKFLPFFRMEFPLN